MIENIRLMGLRSTGDNLKYFKNIDYLEDYYLPFFTYSNNLSFESPENNIKLDYSRIEDRINIKESGFKGRIMYDKKTGEVIKFESKKEILNEYQNLDYIKQLNNVNHEDINIPDIKLNDNNIMNKIYNIKTPLGKDILNFYRRNINMKKYNKEFKNNFKNMISNINLNPSETRIQNINNVDFDYRLQIYKNNFALLDGINNIKESKQMKKMFKQNDKVKYPITIKEKELEKFVEKESNVTDYEKEEIKNTIERISEKFFSHILTVKNKPYDGIYSFRLEGEEYKNPDEIKKQLIKEEEICIAKI